MNALWDYDIEGKSAFQKGSHPILDLGKGFQIIIDFKSWNLEYETQKLPFYKQNL